ncbi:rod-binding protein [Desulfopila sp. IMCC35008]|uniref:rod-binding protein n=1 Tax=Desulfopila sp. IMCC35008 TaxID=2653858 RepID=UPI0013D44102|nr:rod-binding protein [Desulfopila sp. IMCC35008]
MNNTIDPRTVLSHSLGNANNPSQKKTKDLESLRESSRQFETIFVMEMYKAMRKAVPEGGLFEKSVATDTFQEMFDMEIAKQTAAGPGMGIGEAMYRQMATHIEAKKHTGE